MPDCAAVVPAPVPRPAPPQDAAAVLAGGRPAAARHRPGRRHHRPRQRCLRRDIRTVLRHAKGKNIVSA